MQLRYRGAKYQAKVESVETTQTGITARFLGQTYTLRQANYQSYLPADFYKYRGVIYQK